jgi:hypothetical protein
MDAAHTTDEVEFLKAVDRFKRENDRQFPTVCEYLEILLSLGYCKIPQQPG